MMNHDVSRDCELQTHRADFKVETMKTRTRVLARILARIVGMLLGIAVFGFASGAGAVDDPNPLRAPDLASVRAKIEAKDFKSALADLGPMLKSKPSADAHNLMGYSLRKTGDFKQALVHYQKALELDPKHKGALEYLGELYVETDQMPKAQETLARLKAVCLRGCEELTDLEKAIAGAGAKKPK